jgi:hypothetical protein
MTQQHLHERIASIRTRIADAARRAGRNPDEITLVAVSKTHGPEAVVAAYAAGLRIFGENRVEEAGPKAVAVAALLGGQPSAVGGLHWHMIGHLQSRKAEDVLPWADMIHSVDSVRLAARLSRFCVAAGRELPILLEVNASGEASKYGLTADALPEAIAAIGALEGLRLQGLMTMAPIVPDPEDARPVFARLRCLRDELAGQFPALDLHHLSMGMTDDFEVAIEEGATIVRVGRAIFGEREA